MAEPEVVCIPNGVFAENCYIVTDPATRDAVIIDPGQESGLFLRHIDAGRLNLKAVWLTHGHIDHVMGIEDVVASHPAPIYLHPHDRSIYDATPQQGAWMGIPARRPPAPTHSLVDGDVLTVGPFRYQVRHVPGHSPGSVALIGHGVVFGGDVLFAGSVGRTDLPGGDGPTLLRSINDVLMPLPDETIVYSGHGPETSIGRERRENPFLNGTARLV